MVWLVRLTRTPKARAAPLDVSSEKTDALVGASIAQRRGSVSFLFRGFRAFRGSNLGATTRPTHGVFCGRSNGAFGPILR